MKTFGGLFKALLPCHRVHDGWLAFETSLDLASAGQLDGQGDRHSAKPSVRKAFAKYLEGATDISGELMRIIAYITHSAEIRQMREYIGVETESPRIAPPSGSPLWDECDTLQLQMGNGVDVTPHLDKAWLTSTVLTDAKVISVKQRPKRHRIATNEEDDQRVTW